ncbi:Ubiquitin carboxyl-terminal hydrolase 38 [Balamuthia mandrillaris]
MEKVLRGILLSTHPESLKRTLFQRVIQASKPPTTPEECAAACELAVELMLRSGITPLELDVGEAVLSHAVASGQSFVAYFHTRRLLEYLAETSFSLANTIRFLRCVLMLKGKAEGATLQRDCTSLSPWLISLLRESTTADIQVEMAGLLRDVPQLRATVATSIDLSQLCLEWMARISFEPTSSAAESFNIHASALLALIICLWEGRQDKTLTGLVQLFMLLSKDGAPRPGFALANVLCSVHSSYIIACASLLTDPASQVKDSQISSFLRCILNWPLTPTIGEWVTGLLQALGQHAKFSLMCDVIEGSVHIALNQIYVPALREGASKVLEHMLLGFQHSPDIFHALLPSLLPLLHHLQANILTENSSSQQEQENNKKARVEQPVIQLSSSLLAVDHALLHRLLTLFADEDSDIHASNSAASASSPSSSSFSSSSSASSSSSSSEATTEHGSNCKSEEVLVTKDALWRLCRMIYVLTFHHSGYPELYTPILQLCDNCCSNSIIANASEKPLPPSEEDIRKLLADKAWTSQESALVGLSSSFVNDAALKPRQGIQPTGLINLGNTCYMNSFLQALFMTDMFRKTVLKGSRLTAGQGIFSELQRLFAYLLLSQRGAYRPSRFLGTLPSQWRSGIQQDASEFGKFMLDAIEEQALSEKEAADRIRAFKGTLSNTIQCTSCGYLSAHSESFVDLSLSFRENDGGGNGTENSLEDMLDLFFGVEKLEGENKYSCGRCHSLQDAEKRYSITEPPEHMVLTLKRFSYDWKTNTRTKIMKQVSYPLHLEIPVTPSPESSQAPTQGTPAAEPEQRLYSYSLYAVIMHSGTSAHHGHYYCYARSSALAARQGEKGGREEEEAKDWFLLNDSMVSKSSYSSFHQISQRFGRDVPYILFYTRRGRESEQEDETAPTQAPSSLSKEVMEDNKRFLREQEEHVRQSVNRAYRYTSTRGYHGGGGSHYRHWDDEDREDGSGGGFGFGGGMPHFVS